MQFDQANHLCTMWCEIYFIKMRAGNGTRHNPIVPLPDLPLIILQLTAFRTERGSWEIFQAGVGTV